jgi:hypothetical protein
MSSALDRELNEAIVNADIGNSYEEFLGNSIIARSADPLTFVDFGLDGSPRQLANTKPS